MYKIYIKNPCWLDQHVKKILLVMKISALLLIVTIMQVSASTLAQRVTFSRKKASLEQVFLELRKQTGYTVFYADHILNDANLVDANFKNATLDQVLNSILKGQRLNFTIEDRVIIIKKEDISLLDVIIYNLRVIEVSGRVVDANGLALPGASVVVKGKNVAVRTDSNGNFLIRNIDPGSILIISFIGYLNKEVRAIPGLGNVVLELSNSKLDEVQVQAYGVTSKRFGTGNISTVKADEIDRQPVSNPLLALQGRVPGVFIEQASGLPGSGVKVRIQGQNSISSGSDPLYVIDGVPFISQLLPSLSTVQGNSGNSTFSGNPLNFINPQDIESIDVLKDADATSIYGSRAANGVILITTKKGKTGPTRVDLNIQHGVGNVTRKIDLMNTSQYLEMRREAFKNDNIDLNAAPYNQAVYKAAVYPDLAYWDQNRYTNWQKELLGGTARYTHAQASVSGGNVGITYLVSSDFKRETTVLPGDAADQKGSVHLNLNSASDNQRFKFGFSASYLQDNNRLPNIDLTYTALTLPPNAPALFGPSDKLNWDQVNGLSTFKNPLALTLGTLYKNKTSNLIGNAMLSYEILEGFNIKSSFGYTNIHTDELTKVNDIGAMPENMATFIRQSNFGTNNVNSWQIEPQLTYQRKIGLGSLDALVGTTILQQNSDRTALNAKGFSDNLVMDNIGAATSVVPINGGSIISVYKYNALFGRLNYNLDKRYIVSATARRDGSSRFGAENQFHDFWSVAGAWLFSNEKFIKDNLSFLSFGKLRASYGTSGNDQIGDYAYLNLYKKANNSGAPYQGIVGLLPTGIPNPYLQWEETNKLQFGLDLGFLQDRLLLNLNYNRNRSSNQLLPYELPSITGTTAFTSNFPATIQNTGFELGINSINIKNGNFSWTTNFNITVPKNKLIAFKNFETSSYASTYVIGQPISIQRQFHFAGVDPTTGLVQIQDKNGNITSDQTAFFDPTNQTGRFSADPKFYGGFQNNISYKGFTLDFLFQFVKQSAQSYMYGLNTSPPGSMANQVTSVMNRWQKVGDVTDYNKYTTLGGLGYTYLTLYGDNMYIDASYIRLKNISLSWDLPVAYTKKLYVNGLRVYAQGQNVLTLTKYAGLDPENRTLSALPMLRMITVGLKLTL